MKKIIPFLLALVLLTGCTARSFTPVISTEFDVTAVYKAGDFSYNCRITRKKGVVTITSLSGYTKGAKIIFDGNALTFEKDNLKKTIKSEILKSNNPAIMVYQAFDYLEKNDSLDVKKIGDTYQYTGSTDFGTFVLTQKSDNSFASLTFPSVNAEITFTSV